MRYTTSSESTQILLLEPEIFPEFQKLTNSVIEKYSAVVFEKTLSPEGSGSIVLRINRDILRFNYDDFGGTTLETGLCSESFLVELLRYIETL